MPVFVDTRLRLVFVAAILLAGCGSGSGSTGTGPTPPTQPQAAAPTFSTAAAQDGAVIVTLASTTSGATIYYTIDGSTPTTSSTQYLAPFLVASNLTVNAIATASGDTSSAVAMKSFSANIASGTLVWSDEFSNSTSANTLPSASNWTYDTGTDCCGNNEQETYCVAGASTSPCNTPSPNAYHRSHNGGLNIVAESPTIDVFTSARLKSQGLFSFQYGRIEAKMMLPESQGMWPAFWLLGNSIATINWPGCGELDIMEHIDGSDPPPCVGAAPRAMTGSPARCTAVPAALRKTGRRALSSNRIFRCGMAHLRHDLDKRGRFSTTWTALPTFMRPSSRPTPRGHQPRGPLTRARSSSS